MGAPLQRCLVGLCIWLPVAVCRPNILFILGETCNKYHLDRPTARPVPLPAIDRLTARGIAFEHGYVAHPVCCPSRSTIWSGRHAHHLAHAQVQPASGLWVTGAWNNHEGLAADWTRRDPYVRSEGQPGPLILNRTFAHLLGAAGYEVDVQGKTDIASGAHTPHARVTSWTEEVRFPCLRGGPDLAGCHANSSAGWTNEQFPGLTVDWADNAQQSRGYARDWAVTNNTISFIRQMANRSRRPDGSELAPWLAYAGHHICHPGYRTNRYWYQRVNQSRIRIPAWEPLEAMHPEDAEIAMKKHLAAPGCCSDDVKLKFRTVFYAMVGEYDAMIGEILDAVHQSGFDNNTWIIHATDHGDMAFEHRSWCAACEAGPRRG